jgi:putative intracellular protease/amidase
VLIAAGVVESKRVTCYVHVRSEAEAAGAVFVDEQAVVDGALVTGQTWESHPQFTGKRFDYCAPEFHGNPDHFSGYTLNLRPD